MPTNTRTIRNLSLTAIATSLAMGLPTVAQASENQEIEKISVTGSRIAREELTTTSPITIVSKAAMVNMGVTDISSALRKLPALTGNTTNNQSSSGENNIQTATLRGIEATNTLVLINGRRVVGSDDDGLVDLSSIPFEAVQEIQVLKDGASAIYGSDAIAGVINIITRKQYDGFEVNAHYGVSNEGDAQERKVGFTAGMSNDKGSFMVALSSANNSGWEEADRYMTRETKRGYLGGTNISSGTAPNAQLTGFGLPDGSWTVLDANNPSEVVPFDYESMGYNYRAAQSGANDNKTTSIFMTGDYELSDTVQFFTELSFHDGYVQGNQAPPGTDTAYYGSNVDTPNAFKRYPDADGNNFGVGANQKYNPFGEAGNVTRRFSEYGPRIYKTSSDIKRYTVGLRGELMEDYDWEIVFSDQQARMVQDGGAQPSIKMIERALSNECETELDPHCVALNVFGPEGSITQEMLDFINVTAPKQTNKNDLSYLQASIAGPLMELASGDIMFAAGAEYREDQLSQQVDISQRTATFDVSWGGSVTPVISPVREITEFYFETVIPVMDNLTLEAAVRHSDYSDIDETTTNPKFGVIYEPMDELKLRASFSTGFRAPTMAQMYQGRTSAINTDLYDPCNSNNDNVIDANSPASCAALNPANIRNEILSYDQIGGGNPDLKPEEAENMTLGVVFSPMDDLSFTVDYFEIEQTDVVFASAEYVIEQYVAGNPEYANDVIRSDNGTGYIQTVFSPANNIAERHVAGFDLNANYRFDSSIGEWLINLDTTIMDTFDVQDVDGGDFRDAVGTYDGAFGSIPEYKVSMQVDWSMDNFRATWDMNYNSSIEVLDPSGQVATYEVDGIVREDVMDATATHNLQVGYFLEDYATDVHFGIQNIFDKEPPYLNKGVNSTDDNLYSYRGRFFYAGFTTKF